jgi:Nucleoside diphosphate kinase
MAASIASTSHARPLCTLTRSSDYYGPCPEPVTDASTNRDPVWIYVLERPRAAEVLRSVMGDEDPEDARINSPNSLRAVYGADRVDNAFGCAIDPTAVDVLFASSPVWSPGELPELNGKDYSTIRSVNTAFLAALRQGSTPEEGSDAAMYANLVRRGSNPGSATSSVGTPRTCDKSPAPNGKTPFKARPIPATNAPGAVQPRMTKAAALRMGIAIPTENRRHSLDPGAFQKQYEGNVPGYKRNITVQVASIAPPTIVPRATRASQLREGKVVDVPRRQSLDIPRENTFEGVPGHKRRETLAVASTKPPTMAPRPNRSALLRQQKLETPPPSSYMCKSITLLSVLHTH